jgi:hypothetical protein
MYVLTNAFKNGAIDTKPSASSDTNSSFSYFRPSVKNSLKKLQKRNEKVIWRRKRRRTEGTRRRFGEEKKEERKKLFGKGKTIKVSI